MALISPLDLKTIFMTDLAGDPQIFSFLAIILVGFLVGKAGFDNRETLASFALFGIIMAVYLPAIYVVINLIAGIFIAYSVGKITK